MVFCNSFAGLASIGAYNASAVADVPKIRTIVYKLDDQGTGAGFVYIEVAFASLKEVSLGFIDTVLYSHLDILVREKRVVKYILMQLFPLEISAEITPMAVEHTKVTTIRHIHSILFMALLIAHIQYNTNTVFVIVSSNPLCGADAKPFYNPVRLFVTFGLFVINHLLCTAAYRYTGHIVTIITRSIVEGILLCKAEACFVYLYVMVRVPVDLTFTIVMVQQLITIGYIIIVFKVISVVLLFERPYVIQVSLVCYHIHVLRSGLYVAQH